jgi:hypothetical protein
MVLVAAWEEEVAVAVVPVAAVVPGPPRIAAMAALARRTRP